MSIWKEDNCVEENIDLYKKIDVFFENTKTSKVLEYREGQHTMALDVLDAIKNKDILLIEAGVGIGKSYAYAVPLLYAYENVEKFNGFIISTSSIALEEQLKEAITSLAQDMGIEIPVTVAKGKTNYACLRKLKNLSETEEDEKQQEVYQELLARTLENEADCFALEDVEEETWNKIHITSCAFQKCPEYYHCPYIIEREKFSQGGAIICNHDLLIQNLMRSSDEKIFQHPQALVIDEAHQLEEKIRNANVHYLDKRRIENIVYRIHNQIFGLLTSPLESDFFDLLNSIFSRIRTSAKIKALRDNEEQIDLDKNTKAGFSISKDLRDDIIYLIDFLKKTILLYEKYEKDMNSAIPSSEIDEIKDTIKVLKDMLLRENSKNVYWASFFGDKAQYVRVYYSPRNLSNIASRLLSDSNYGKILTSATLTTGKDDYSYFANGIGLDKIVGINTLKEFPQASPYDYKNNSLIYLDKTVPTPDNKEAYLEAIYERIRKLLALTEGKSLVLFTSKNDMNYVHERLLGTTDFQFPIYKQEKKNEYQIKKQFAENTDSCLFATGAFWEGIDIQGKSLSNLIITRLPFPIVDPIMNEKAREYSDGFGKVYLPEMILKLKQGIGRAIRSEEDSALISILDSRLERYNQNYNNIIYDNFSLYPITSNEEEVEEFVKRKIL